MVVEGSCIGLLWFFFICFFFFFNDTATTEIYTLSLHDALPICFRGLRTHLELHWQRRGSGDQRMVAPHLARLRQTLEHRALIMTDERGLAVHEPIGPHHLAPEHFHDRLVSEAYPEHRDAPGERADHVHGYARIVRCPGTGRDAQVRGRERLRRFRAQGVVAVDAHLSAQDQERLHQVVGEGVVVVDQQQARLHNPSSASSSARTRAALLANTSSCSVSGTLSATIPAPAW